jgi:DNA-binding SARP family transcriptional activator
MEIRLLGPVELRVDGKALEVGPPKRRAVLASLAVDAGRPVAMDTVVDRVWDQEPPAQARGTLYGHIMRIRRTLAEATRTGEEPPRLPRQDGGYLLDIDPDLVDLHRFRHLTEQARQLEDDEAGRAALLREALNLWRGTPLAGLPDVSWVLRVRESCRQLRLDAASAWAGTELRLGNHEAVLGALPDLVGEYPLVEPLTAILMRALYAAGRVADALDCYTAIRRRLADELGLDPGPELRQLHQAMLRGGLEPPPDVPAVEPAAPGVPEVPEVAQAPRRAARIKFRRRRAVLVASTGVALSLLATGTAWTLTLSGEPAAHPTLAGSPGGGSSALPSGWVRIRPVTAPGLCLADGRVRDQRYTPLVAVQLPCGDVAPLETRLEPLGGDAYRIVWYHPDYGTGCLMAWSEGPQTGLLEPMDDCGQGSRFHVERSGAPGSGVYVFRVDGQGCVGIRNSDTHEGTEALMGQCAHDAQRFHVEPAS